MTRELVFPFEKEQGKAFPKDKKRVAVLEVCEKRMAGEMTMKFAQFSVYVISLT